MNTANIFYHANCTDGEVSHWIAKTSLEAIGVACTSYPVSYGDDLKFMDSLEDSTFTLILDFSFSKEIHHQLERMCKNFIWLDHHQSAADKHNGWGKRCTSCNGLFSFEAMVKEKSGCGLTFDFFADEFSEYFDHYGWTSKVQREKVFNVEKIVLNDRIRRITNLVEDRDIWKFHFGDDSLVMHAFLNAEKLSYKRLNYLMALTENDYCKQWEEAKIKLEYRKELTQKWAAKGIKKKVTLLDGTSFEVMVANVPADFSSDVCAAMYEKNPTLLTMAYVIGEKVYVSLRSKQGVGPSAKNVAEVFGGGGHENAAGFSVSTIEDFFSIFH